MNKTKNPSKMSPLLIWNVPKEVRLRFKLACVRKGRTMRDVIMEFLKNYA